jgi:hypothetical protein
MIAFRVQWAKLNSWPYRDRNCRRSVAQLVAIRYTDFATAAVNVDKGKEKWGVKMKIQRECFGFESRGLSHWHRTTNSGL